MHSRLALWMSVVSAAAALSSACGSSTSLASQLSPTGATLSSLTLTTNTPAVGASIQATATAFFSNGTTSPVASGFTSDAPSVATVTASGSVSGVAIGDATISVDYQGMRASKKIHVLPGYGGIFVGSYTVSGCSATGGFVSTDPTQDFCSVFATGLTPGIAFNISQSGDLTTMSAQFVLGGLSGGTGTGTISPAGTLTFTGNLILGTGRVDVSNWTATSPAPGRMTGSFQMTFTDSTLAGSGIVTTTNLDMTRQSSSFSAGPRALSGPAGWRALTAREIRR